LLFKIVLEDRLMRINVTKTFLVLFALLICASIHAQIKGTMIDSRDGQVYKTVEIANRTWMAQNLNYESTDSLFYKKFIQPISMLNQFGVLIPDSYCYGDVLINCEKYGRLYHYDAAMKVCPLGWHLPDTSEYNSLLLHLQQAAGNDKYKLYQSLLPGGSSGFDLLYAGFRWPLFSRGQETRSSYSALGMQTYLLVSDTTQITRKTKSIYQSRYNTALSLFVNLRKKGYLKIRFIEENSFYLSSVRCTKDKE